MSMAVLLTCLLITLARVMDMTLDTLRTVAVVQGRRLMAAVLGFLEAVVYICAVAKVLQNFDRPVYAVAYASGFAIGTYLGMTIDRYLAMGEQLASVFTRYGLELATTLRSEGYRVTETRARGRDGEVSVLYIKIPRRQTGDLIARARELDGDCYYIVNDVRLAAPGGAATPEPHPAAARRRMVA